EEYKLEEAIVRLILKLTPETEARFNEGIVRDALRRARVSSVAAIRKEIDEPARARLGDNPEGLTDLELLERYMISKQIDGERRAQLLEEAETIIDRVQARM